MSKGAGAHGPHNEIQWNGFGRILLTHTASYSAHAFLRRLRPLPKAFMHTGRRTIGAARCRSKPLLVPLRRR